MRFVLLFIPVLFVLHTIFGADVDGGDGGVVVAAAAAVASLIAASVPSRILTWLGVSWPMWWDGDP